MIVSYISFFHLNLVFFLFFFFLLFILTPAPRNVAGNHCGRWTFRSFCCPHRARTWWKNVWTFAFSISSKVYDYARGASRHVTSHHVTHYVMLHPVLSSTKIRFWGETRRKLHLESTEHSHALKLPRGSRTAWMHSTKTLPNRPVSY